MEVVKKWTRVCEKIQEGDSEEEPLKPTSRQAINYKIKKLQDLKEKSEKLKSSIQKGKAQRFTLGKSSVDKSVKSRNSPSRFVLQKP